MKKNNVAIAMSGGIDSSVAAFLLQKKHQVFGVTMFLGSFHNQAVERARTICQRLKIPHYVIDLEKEFQKEIINPFIKEYCQARTPNPCILCNQRIKFGHLLNHLWTSNVHSPQVIDICGRPTSTNIQKLEVGYLATGHYARINKINDQYILKKAKYKNRDQSYFLYRLSQRQLSQIIFPLGNMSKKQVEKIAIQNNLCFPNQKESREICFIPDNDYRNFLEKYSSYPPGPIKDLKGNILGEHQGLPFYTIGQRKGLISGSKFPLYAVRIDKKENTIILGSEKDLYQKQLVAKNITWTNNQFPVEIKNGLIKAKDITVKIRYRHKSAKISKIILTPVRPVQVKIEFKKAQRAITPGQSMVIYNGEQVLGGGIISVGAPERTLPRLVPGTEK